MIDCFCTKATGTPDPDCKKCGGSGVVPLGFRIFHLVTKKIEK